MASGYPIIVAKSGRTPYAPIVFHQNSFKKGGGDRPQNERPSGISVATYGHTQKTDLVSRETASSTVTKNRKLNSSRPALLTPALLVAWPVHLMVRFSWWIYFVFAIQSIHSQLPAGVRQQKKPYDGEHVPSINRWITHSAGMMDTGAAAWPHRLCQNKCRPGNNI
jgi:hypothetical protein